MTDFKVGDWVIVHVASDTSKKIEGIGKITDILTTEDAYCLKYSIKPLDDLFGWALTEKEMQYGVKKIRKNSKLWKEIISKEI